MNLQLVVLAGSVRADRQGIKAVRFVDRAFAARGHAVTVIDPMVEQLPLLDRMRFERVAAELEWYASALREARKAGVPS